MAQLTIQQAFDLALQHQQAGRWHEAEQLYRQILSQQPEHVDSLHQLATLALSMKRYGAATELFQQAIALQTDNAAAYSNLGVALTENGQLDEAIAAYRNSLTLRPGSASTCYNLAAALQRQGKLNEAIDAYRNAIVLSPHWAEAHNNLGNVLQRASRYDEAIAAYRRCIGLKPNFALAHSNLGNSLKDVGQMGEAVAAFRKAIALNPNLAEAYGNLGNAMKDMGQIDEAVAAYRQVIALEPGSATSHSDLLLAMHYHSSFSATEIAEEHRRWGRQHGEPLQKFIQPHFNDRSPNRRLRIGYVSPDFHDHSVCCFFLPLLRAHDPDHFEISCYSNLSVGDRVTEEIQKRAGAWREIYGLSDAMTAEIIREDQIDILVDLAGHTAGNRLLVFAQKPAPVQVTYLGYPNTTGLSTIDYRITDALADPPGLDDSFHTERLIRLPQTNWIYQPPHNSPEPRERPSTAPIQFGCFNYFAKVTEAMLKLWARILASVPGSTLLLKSKNLASAEVERRVHQLFRAEGISAERVRLMGWTQSTANHLALYNEIAIGLDPFPYHGTTTTCEALWMGVPVISLAGQTHVSRVGVSLLTNVGLGDLVAESPEDYVRIAVKLSNDRPQLRHLHATLRQRMQQSPLMDTSGFARNIETEYRQMWLTWYAQASATLT